ncbi:sensor histidine kinase [Microbacterium album]|uniref:histidine kinase n=1 Tax=Microbacterium album TaxID=2053191 RepID=A0A917MMF1_9MICO|nr:sensor histidine kinase [Microbacterium album]GGH44118.1 two-component sensor histidine kinase [Microbacterium album]
MSLLTRAPARPATDPAPPDAPLVRPRPTAADLRLDGLLAGGLFVTAMISLALSSISGIVELQHGGSPWLVVFSALMTLPLALRRRLPITVAVVVCGAYFAQASIFALPELYVSQVAMFAALFTIGAWVNDRRRAAWARILIIVAMFVWLLVNTYLGAVHPTEDPEMYAGAFSPYVAFMLMQWLINAAYFGGAYYLGDRAYAAALDRHALRERTRELEEERETSAAQAVALDRVRIARELHDVVAHHVSAMGVQAGAARTVLDRDVDAARAMLESVERSARSAIDELHHLLDTLRTPEDEDAPPSTLRLDRLESLARQVSAAGTPTTFTVVGDPVEVPEIVHVNLYRIAQEALTNARRHGGPGVTADVRLRYEPGAVELEVTNTGRVRPGARPGMGQLGMRERAIASGGTLEFGRRERGGYLVRVRVPVRTAVPA